MTSKALLWTTSPCKIQQKLLDTSLIFAKKVYPELPRVVYTNDLTYKNDLIDDLRNPDWPDNHKQELKVFDLLPLCDFDIVWSLCNRTILMFNFDELLKTDHFECIIRPNARTPTEKRVPECNESFIVSNAFFQINRDEIKDISKHKKINKPKSAYEQLTKWSVTRTNCVYHKDLYFPTGLTEMFEMKKILKKEDINKMPVLELSENYHLENFRQKHGLFT